MSEWVPSSDHDSFIANSYFLPKPQHKVSWRQPRSKNWHQLDMILFMRSALKNVLHTHSYHTQSTDCDTDHSLVCCSIKLHPKKFHCLKTGEILYWFRRDVPTKPHGAMCKSLLWENSNMLHSSKTLPQKSRKTNSTRSFKKISE